MSVMSLADWLEERRQNCLRIAAQKSGAEQHGWLEDEAYFRCAALVAQAVDVGDGSENVPLRMFIALRILRAWNSGTAGYSAVVVQTVNEWIDDGMKGPIPWPSDPFFADWATQHGYSNVHGHVGFTLRMKLDEIPQ